jgi:hypothetical protein
LKLHGFYPDDQRATRPRKLGSDSLVVRAIGLHLGTTDDDAPLAGAVNAQTASYSADDLLRIPDFVPIARTKCAKEDKK